MKELVSNHPFLEFAALLFLAALFGIAARLLRQPLIVAFIALGIIAGPAAFNLIVSDDEIHLLADIGIAILLFVVGLKLDLKLIRTTGTVALFTGMGQVIFTSLIGFLLAVALGFGSLPALYIAVALTFSSTIIIVKLLSDKKEIDSLHGQIAIGFLIVQDIVVVLVMIVLSAINTEADQSLGWVIGAVTFKGLLLLTITGVMMRWVLPGLSAHLASSQELLVLFAIAWAMTLAGLSEAMGFSREVGAFLAGIALASTHYREVISGRLTSIRDFLLLFFFIHLGAGLKLDLLGEQLWAAGLLSVFVLIGNPLIVMVIMGLMGYRKRTSFLAGLAVAQISEFSLIFIALGLNLGHVNDEVVGLVTLVGLITIGLSTYMILYSHQLFEWLSPILSIFERTIPHREAQQRQNQERHYDVILFGLGRYGGNMLQRLHRNGLTVLAVDFDPQQVKYWQSEGMETRYGDIEDPELAEQLPLKHTSLVISSLPGYDANVSLLKCLKAAQYSGKTIVTAHSSEDAGLLQTIGADQVLMPFIDAADVIIERIAGLVIHSHARQSPIN